jgi:hypothetical protein
MPPPSPGVNHSLPPPPNLETTKLGGMQRGPFTSSYWFSGFIDGDASFQIKIINRKNRNPNKPEIRLQLQIALNEKYKYLLDYIKRDFGGYIGSRLHKDLSNSFYYNSTNFQVFKKLVNYLDYYPLCSNKYKEYVI